MAVEIKPGDSMRWSRSFTEDDIRKFAELSGDKGAHHLKPDASGRWMAHGLLTATLPTKLGGDLNYIARKMEFGFLRPVYAGDELQCEGVVESVAARTDRLQVELSFKVTNAQGKTVLRGKTSGIIWRTSAGDSER